MDQNFSAAKKNLREEGAKALYESLKKSNPNVTMDDCYKIYDKMQEENLKSKGA
jgi:hypothetical protein